MDDLSRPLERDVNPRPPVYEAGALLTQPRRSLRVKAGAIYSYHLSLCFEPLTECHFEISVIVSSVDAVSCIDISFVGIVFMAVTYCWNILSVDTLVDVSS
jgi:hypothetical protein